MPPINACCALTLCLIYTVYETVPVLRHELHNSLFCHLVDPGQAPQTVIDQKEKRRCQNRLSSTQKIIRKSSRQTRDFVQGIKERVIWESERLDLYFLRIFGSESDSGRYHTRIELQLCKLSHNCPFKYGKSVNYTLLTITVQCTPPHAPAGYGLYTIQYTCMHLCIAFCNLPHV